MEFGQLSFFLSYVQIIGVFAGRLCLAELFGYPMQLV